MQLDNTPPKIKLISYSNTNNPYPKYANKTHTITARIQIIEDNISEIKYIFAYLSKTLGLTDPNEYKFDENAQFILESIIFTAMNLYNNGGATKSKLIASHDRFVQEIESKKEEALSRTQQINTIKLQALRELGYTALTSENAQEVLNKIAEIETRKVVNK